MIQTTFQVNSLVSLTVRDPSGLAAQPVPADLTLLKDGAVVATPAVTMTDVGTQGLYNFTFTPQATGVYVLFAHGAVQARIEVVTRTIYSYLQNLEDESIGSWQWDKTTGTLTMLRQDGTNLASFTVTDTLTEASRERTT